MCPEEVIWPNFFVVGAPKCGTTSLYERLKLHPQVFLPEMKDPNFFTTPPPSSEKSFDLPRCSTLEEYQRLYKDARGFIAVGDPSNSYLWDENAPGRIHEVCPEAKIIVMLRDPVARAHSFYLMNVRDGFESSPTFRRALDQDKARNTSNWFTAWLYVEGGLYHKQVRRYIDAFGARQVLVLLFDDLAKNPLELFSRIASHIGVDPSPFGSIEVSEPYNPYRMPRSRAAYRIAGMLGLRGSLIPPAARRWLSRSPLLFDKNKPQIDPESRRYLQQIYDPDIAHLEMLLGRTMPELRKNWI
jgi:hypothetical protein